MTSKQEIRQRINEQTVDSSVEKVIRHHGNFHVTLSTDILLACEVSDLLENLDVASILVRDSKLKILVEDN